MTQFVQLTSKDGFTLSAYVAEPEGAPRGGVVVVQEIFGVNHHIRDVADAYARAGYVAVAPAIFERVQHGVDLGYTPDDIKKGIALKAALEAHHQQAVLGDLQAAIDLAARRSGGKVGIVGYCYGGLLAWRAAAGLHGLSAAAPYYGGGVTTPDEAARTPKVPVIAHFGERDAHIPVADVEALRERHANGGVKVHIYPADHGFNCDQRGAYDATAAELARERTLAFFAEHVASQPTA
ncbi:MAG: Carboxymethylenebutenolidase [Paracidovorax wautersii]|uniref:Carboxymethylenebutenolidase n=1 Tax=Paracidovorax wautersii TaxID=1177982 RepID=A0A7V8FP47_9BURK|nr:MAG: Carboxymethylenebutenolidase [Paracidovorax wautersii]